MKKLTLALALLLPMAAGAITPKWLRDVKISPDGTVIAFTYKGDIWTVPVSGGEATRLTTTTDNEAYPIWSPDGSKIAFAGDAAGNYDIYVMDAKGGVPERLTFNSTNEIPESFTTDGNAIIFSGAIQDPASSAIFPDTRFGELYTVDLVDGKLRQLIATAGRYVSCIDDRSFYYQDFKVHEDEWRKHHTSSVTRDIWKYDGATGTFTNLTTRGGEDVNPVAGEGDTFYFLSERDGKSYNVYRSSVSNPKQAEAITSFETHPVRFLSRGSNGVLAFTYNGEIFTMTPGSQPQKVAIDLIDNELNRTERLSVSSGSGAVASPDGKSVAFVNRGEVFVTSVEYTTTKQITNTTEAEGNISWTPDSKALLYDSERDGYYNIYRATIAREGEEPNFANATVINEEPVFEADGHEYFMGQMSPDGKKLAFIRDRKQLWMKDVETGKMTQLTDGSQWYRRAGGFNYSWSPDSRWIVLEIIDRHRDPYTDIAIVDTTTGKLTNLTNSGYFDESPRWALDGNAIAFASERYGMRNHASWGSEMDVMLVFLNQDSYDRFKLSAEDYALLKDVQNSNKKSGNKDKKTKGDADADNEGVKAVDVQLDGIDRRVVRLTPMSSDLKDFIITGDGETLYYITQGQDKRQLWKNGLRKDEVKLVGNIDGGSSFDSNEDGKTLFVFGSSMKKLDPKTDKLTAITASSNMTLDRAAERNYMYEDVVREIGKRFFSEDMNGVDWEAMAENYRQFLPYINNNYDFAELLSELCGELNVSHTGGRFRKAVTKQDDQTAMLGVIFDLDYKGEGLRVAEIVKGGPFDNASTNLRPGFIVDEIDGQRVNFDGSWAKALNNKRGRKTLVSFYNPESGKIFEEVILPISRSKFYTLLYDRWVAQRAALVDSLSGGRLGYVHLKSMGDESFRKVYSDVLGKYNDREGIVIDIRGNGGGRLHEDIEILFSGQKYFNQEIRGVKSCDMPSRRWNKPSIMVVSEACYSNAHGTPWVYKHQGLGKLVGMPIPGTMSSVNWENLQEPQLVYGMPVICYRLPDGSILENSQLEPDIKVANTPERVISGEDDQLRTAVEELLKEIDGK